MTEAIKVKTEQSDRFDDALSTLASAALATRDSMPVPKHESDPHAMSNGVTSPVNETTAAAPVPAAASVPAPASVPTPVPAPASVPAPAAASEPPWYDVGVVKTTSCLVTEFYLSDKPIDHSARTSEQLPSYANLRKVALLPGNAYKFRVAALNACGVGEWSEVTAFKTCLPGFPGAPGSIRISKMNEGATLRWEPPTICYGNIVEYSVCLGVKNEAVRAAAAAAAAENVSLKDLRFVRVYCGVANEAFVEQSSLKAAHIDRSVKPAIIFRIAARNEKGYGPATQVRWLQDHVGAECGGAKKRSSTGD